jgi:hypothetical protein
MDLIIDCDRCAVRGTGCSECVVSLLLGVPVEPAVRRAVDLFAEAGMLPEPVVVAEPRRRRSA